MARKSRKNVGLIGLGIIGTRVAQALRGGGWHVYVWNRTPRAAPNFLASPKQVAELCDVIQLFVADAQALFDVIDAMGDALTPQHVILCNATVGPEATLEAAGVVMKRGARFLDAPFTGSKAAAENKQLVYYIGGDEDVLRQVEPVLKASSKSIVKIGKIGDAAIIKVATNMISAVTVQTVAEAYAIVKGSGIPPTALRDALENHAVRSGVVDQKLGKILEQDYEPHFSLKHMFKDVQLGIHIANALDVDMPATTATAGVMYGGLARGWADEDFAVLGRNYQQESEAAAEQHATPKTEPQVFTTDAGGTGDEAAAKAAGATPKPATSPEGERKKTPTTPAPEETAGKAGPASANGERIEKTGEAGTGPEPGKQAAKPSPAGEARTGNALLGGLAAETATSRATAAGETGKETPKDSETEPAARTSPVPVLNGSSATPPPPATGAAPNPPVDGEIRRSSPELSLEELKATGASPHAAGEPRPGAPAPGDPRGSAEGAATDPMEKPKDAAASAGKSDGEKGGEMDPKAPESENDPATARPPLPRMRRWFGAGAAN